MRRPCQLFFCRSCVLVHAGSSSLPSNAIVEAKFGTHDLAIVVTDPASLADQYADPRNFMESEEPFDLLHALSQHCSRASDATARLHKTSAAVRGKCRCARGCRAMHAVTQCGSCVRRRDQNPMLRWFRLLRHHLISVPSSLCILAHVEANLFAIALRIAKQPRPG